MVTRWIKEPRPGQSLHQARVDGLWVRYGNTAAELESWKSIRRIGLMVTAVTKKDEPPPQDYKGR